MKKALDSNFVDELTREAALIYCKDVEKYINQRSGRFQTGLYPASINVAMADATGATLDCRNECSVQCS